MEERLFLIRMERQVNGEEPDGSSDLFHRDDELGKTCLRSHLVFYIDTTAEIHDLQGNTCRCNIPLRHTEW